MITYEYDALNRLVTKTMPNEPNTVFFYDISGRLVKVDDGRTVSEGGGITSYKYDRIGRVREVDDIEGRIVKYEYDSRGLRTKLTYPDNSYVNYEYDALSRLKRVKYNGETVAEYSYDELSRRTLLEYGNDTNVVYQYDIANRLTRLTNHTSPTETIDFNYADYDKVGNRLSCKEGPADKQIYDYDKLYQLTFVDYNDGSTAGYDYDKMGNRRLMSNGTQTTYQSNGLNQYTKVNTTNYTYDKNGNLTFDGIYRYYYDVENRLTEVNDIGNQRIVTYKYDFAGRRVRKAVNAGMTTVFCYDGDRIAADYGSGGILRRKYVFGPGIDERICMVSSGKKYYYHYDGLGSVREVIDQEGAVANHYTYDSWGAPVSGETQETVSNLYRFANYVYDSEIYQYHCYRRQYDPVLGRFTSRDPVQGNYEEPMTLHRYLYCINNPINETDPTGKAGAWIYNTIDSVNTYYGALDAALSMTGDPADMLDWLPGINDYREYLFSSQNLNRPLDWQAAMSYAIDEIGKVCDWSGLGKCVGKEIVISGIMDFSMSVVGEMACYGCQWPYGDPSSKAVLCTACGGYKVYQFVSKTTTALNIGFCILENCNWKL